MVPHTHANSAIFIHTLAVSFSISIYTTIPTRSSSHPLTKHACALAIRSQNTRLHWRDAHNTRVCIGDTLTKRASALAIRSQNTRLHWPHAHNTRVCIGDRYSSMSSVRSGSRTTFRNSAASRPPNRIWRSRILGVFRRRKTSKNGLGSSYLLFMNKKSSFIPFHNGIDNVSV